MKKNEESPSPSGEELAIRVENCRLCLNENRDHVVEFYLPRFLLNRGERVALVGPSGCGKTTLLNLIAGLIQADQGMIEILGQRLDRLRRWKTDTFRGRSMGFVYQSLNLFDGFSVLENILVAMRFGRSVQRSEQVNRAKELLDRVGLGGRFHEYPTRFSMGERQRVAIARALASRPDLLLADEPTGSLDPVTASGVFELIQELCGETGCSLLFVTHDLNLATRFPRQFDCRDLVVHRMKEGGQS